MAAYGAFSALAQHQDTQNFYTSSDDSGEDEEVTLINTPDAISAEMAEGVWPTGGQKRKHVPVRLFSPPLEELKLSPSRLQLINPDSVTPRSTPSPGGKRAMTPMEAILTQSSSGSSVDPMTPRSSGRSSPITPPRSPATILDRKHHMREVLKNSNFKSNTPPYKFFLEPNVFFEEMINQYEKMNKDEQSDVARSRYEKVIQGLTLLSRQLNSNPSDTECNEIFSSAHLLLFQEAVHQDEKWLMRELCYQYSRFGVEEVELNPLERDHDLGFFHSYHIKVDTLFSELELVPSEQCLVDTSEYLSNRLSGDAVHHMLQNPDKIEVFLGSAKDMKRFYQQEFGATKCYEFNQASSFTINLFVNDANQSLIVLNQIDSEENLIHRLYQLHFAGITIGDMGLFRSKQIFRIFNKSYWSLIKKAFLAQFF